MHVHVSHSTVKMANKLYVLGVCLCFLGLTAARFRTGGISSEPRPMDASTLDIVNSVSILRIKMRFKITSELALLQTHRIPTRQASDDSFRITNVWRRCMSMTMIRPRSDVVYGICRGLPSDRTTVPIIFWTE